MTEGMIQGVAGATVAFGVVYVLRNVVFDLVKRQSIFNNLIASTHDVIGTGIAILIVGRGRRRRGLGRGRFPISRRLSLSIWRAGACRRSGVVLSLTRRARRPLCWPPCW